MPSGDCFAVFVISYKTEAKHKSAKMVRGCSRPLSLLSSAINRYRYLENNKVEIATANEIHAAPVRITLRLSKVRPSGLMNGHSDSVVMS